MCCCHTVCLWLVNPFLCHLFSVAIHRYRYYFLKLFPFLISIACFRSPFPPFHPLIHFLLLCYISLRFPSCFALISQLCCSHLHFCSVFVFALNWSEKGWLFFYFSFTVFFILLFLYFHLEGKTSEIYSFYPQKCSGNERRKW